MQKSEKHGVRKKSIVLLTFLFSSSLVTLSKNNEDSSKPSPEQQSTIKNQGAATTHGLPVQKSSALQTRPLQQGVMVTNAQPQRKATTSPSAPIQRSATQPAAVVSLNQGLPRGISSQPLQYQPLTLPSKSTAGTQNTATALPFSNPSAAVLPLNQGLQPVQYQPPTWPPMSTEMVKKPAAPVPALVPSNQLQQPSHGLITPAQPATQYMWVPASAIQQNMPVVYANPVAPSLQGGPMFVSYPRAGQFIPQQAPVVLMTSQPLSTSCLPRTTMQAAITKTSGRGKEVTPVSNRPSGGTVTTFSVLPQHVGQLAVQSAQRNNVGSVRQPTATVNEASVGSAMPSSGKQPVVPSFPQSSHQTTSITSPLPSTTFSITSLPHQPSTPSVTTVSQSQTLPDVEVSRSSEGSQSHESVPGNSLSRESEGSFLVADETDPSPKDSHPPLRRAGRTITWRYRTQGKSKLQEMRKSLAKDLRGKHYYFQGELEN